MAVSGERGTKSQQQDRQNQRDRDRSVAGGGSGERGTRSQQQDRRNMGAARQAGNRAPGVARGGAFGAGSSTAADHLVAIGRARTPSIPSTGVAQGNYPTQDDAYTDFSKAVGKHATRGWMDKLADFLGGSFYDPKEPMAGNPRSFAGGDFHSTSNPGGIMGGLIGSFGGPLGTLAGKVAGPAYTKAGLPEVWHGGYDQPDLRPGPFGNTNTQMGGTMSDIGSGHTYASGSAPGSTPNGYGGQLAGGGTGNGLQNAGAVKPQVPTMNPNVAKAQALAGPVQPMQAPEWWRMPF